MKIKSYEFGKIAIDGKMYTGDAIVYNVHVNSSWWEKEGYYLQIEDFYKIEF